MTAAAAADMQECSGVLLRSFSNRAGEVAAAITATRQASQARMKASPFMAPFSDPRIKMKGTSGSGSGDHQPDDHEVEYHVFPSWPLPHGLLPSSRGAVRRSWQLA